MRQGHRSIEELMTALGDEAPERRIKACAALRDLGTSALPAVPLLVAALDDDRFVQYNFQPDYGGDGGEVRTYVANEALLTLRKVAPDAAPDEVARALVRLHGRTDSARFLGHGLVRESQLAWEGRDLKPFGRPLVDALRRLEHTGDDDQRDSAKAIAERLVAALA